MKISNSSKGTQGEREVIALICCPNCSKKLMALPPNYPLYDIQCTGCLFRAQVKTNNSKPKAIVFGAGWQIMHKVMRSGYMVPPLLLYFKWTEKGKKMREVRFYPFVPKKNLVHRRLPKYARRANYEMFNYVGMTKLPFFTLYPEMHG